MSFIYSFNTSHIYLISILLSSPWPKSLLIVLWLHTILHTKELSNYDRYRPSADWIPKHSCMVYISIRVSWWRHQMEAFSALLAICAGNSSVPGVFPAQRPVTRSFDVFFDLRLNKRLSKQSWGWWFETPSRPLWRHCNVFYISMPKPVVIYEVIVENVQGKQIYKYVFRR